MDELVENEAPGGSRTVRAALGSVVFLIALAAASALGYWLGRQRFEPRSSPALLDVAPGEALSLDAATLAQLRLPTLDGNLLGPADLGARAVVLEFWATWCGPCTVQADILRLLSDEYRGRDVAFLAVNFGEPRDVVRAFTEKKPIPYPLVLDEDASVSVRAGVGGLPTVVVLGARGEVLLQNEGITGATTLRRALDAALAG